METIGGVHAVREALRRAPHRVRKLVLAEGKLDEVGRELQALARSCGVPVYREPRERLSRYLDTGSRQSHQGVVVELAELEWKSLDELLAHAPARAFFLALDQVEDPRNFGAIVRTADGAGVHGILVTERRSAPPSPVAIAASSGALLDAPLARVPNLSDGLIRLKENGFWVVGLSPGAATSWYAFDYTEPLVLVLGSEGRGLRRRVAKTCDALVSIPQLGRIESLNVSVAAGVVLYEVVRQRSGLSGRVS